MTHRFKVGELAILQNPTYRHNPHNALCVVTQPYAPRPAFNTAVRPPVKLPPEWLYVESAQEVRLLLFDTKHRKQDAPADCRAASSKLEIAEKVLLQVPLYRAQKRSSTGSADSSPGRCC